MGYQARKEITRTEKEVEEGRLLRGQGMRRMQASKREEERKDLTIISFGKCYNES